jgi:hypothetical protein
MPTPAHHGNADVGLWGLLVAETGLYKQAIINLCHTSSSTHQQENITL